MPNSTNKELLDLIDRSSLPADIKQKLKEAVELTGNPGARGGPQYVACVAAATTALGARIAAGVDPATAYEIYLKELELCQRFLPSTGTAVTPGDPHGGIVFPPNPPAGWPPFLEWPPRVVHGTPTVGPTSTPTPTPAPTPSVPSGFAPGAELASQTLFLCKEAILTEIPASICVRITVSENGGGTADQPGVVDIYKNGLKQSSIVGDGTATVCGPCTLKAHLQSGEDACKIKIVTI